MGKEAKLVSNWSKLKGKVAKAKPVYVKPIVEEEKVAPAPTRLKAKEKELYVGLDCEMVGIGPEGKQSALARCCLVSFEGEVLYDEYVRPPGYVTDFRTKYSGIRKSDLRQGTAITLQEVGPTHTHTYTP
jgi:interferon-stimulated exonuclease-like 2